ncbi:MAG TPA: PrsW family glutamic-type intramembrane protease [Steroidobacteraceae bacterium]|nr:PrsW family glutamic-type intramembrane protease [Steroidobacteraceae bacterium]
MRQRTTIFLEQLAHMVGVQPLHAVPLRAMWTEVFSVHTEEAVETCLAAGAPLTTPALDAVSTQWPRPWVFGRLLLLGLLIYGAFSLAWSQSGNRNLIPGLILAGSFAVPMSTLVLFFECNVRRNVSLYQLMRVLLLGGVLALLLSLLVFRIGAALPLQGLGAAVAGLVEEPAKLLTLGFLINNPRYRFTLNGLLLGAAVGTGFAAFESAGYAFRAGLEGGSLLMRDVILSRGLLAPFTHIVWTAMAAGALWRVKGAGPFSWRMLEDSRFRRVFAVAVVLHMVWDTQWPLGGDLLYLMVGLAGWFMVASLIQEGLEEIRRQQGRH